MHDIVILIITFAIMIVLLRAKLKIGYVMLLGSASLALLYLLAPMEAMRAIIATLKSSVTMELLTALALIRMLEMVLREQGVMQRMMDAFKHTLKSPKAVLISMPLLIGMLPSVGGAYFSAPMVQEAARDENMNAVDKAFVNYWFRHPWEFILPLYPGVLLASAVAGIELRTLMLYNLLPAVLMFALGFVFSMRGLRKTSPDNPSLSIGDRGYGSFIPIALILLMVIALGVRLYIALIIVVVGLTVFYRYGPRKIYSLLKHGFSPDVILLIVGVMLFKETMEATGSVGNISGFFTRSNIPLMPMLVLLPFMVGLLTGLTVGFVGATFPLIISLTGGDTNAAIALAFASGFAGVMLSPVHVCLILTEQYFCAGMTGVYRKMRLPVAIIVMAACALYLLQ